MRPEQAKRWQRAREQKNQHAFSRFGEAISITIARSLRPGSSPHDVVVGEDDQRSQQTADQKADRERQLSTDDEKTRSREPSVRDASIGHDRSGGLTRARHETGSGTHLKTASGIVTRRPSHETCVSVR